MPPKLGEHFGLLT